jgi:hypothetical protein
MMISATMHETLLDPKKRIPNPCGLGDCAADLRFVAAKVTIVQICNSCL